jgi:hypothetical protein
MLWRVTADIVVAVHAAYVAIVVVGFAAILIGSAAQWRWVRNFYLRAAHLAMILLVCAEALVGTTCPLTRELLPKVVDRDGMKTAAYPSA